MAFIKDVKEDVVKFTAFDRAVVAKRVGIVAAITVLVQLAVNYGWFDINASNEILHWLNVSLDGAGALVAIGITHPAVTPVKDPRNNAGTALIPVSQVQALVANAVDEAKSGNLTEAVTTVKEVASDAKTDVTAEVDTLKTSAAEVKADVAPVVEEVEGGVDAPPAAEPVVEQPVVATTVDDSDDTTETVTEEAPTAAPAVPQVVVVAQPVVIEPNHPADPSL